MSVDDGLARIRNRSRHRWIATGLAALVGLGLSTLHWGGLVVGGVGVGMASANVRRALLAGVGFGFLVWGVFAATFLLDGAFDAYLATGPLAALAVAIPVAGGLLGSLSRAVV